MAKINAWLLGDACEQTFIGVDREFFDEEEETIVSQLEIDWDEFEARELWGLPINSSVEFVNGVPCDKNKTVEIPDAVISDGDIAIVLSLDEEDPTEVYGKITEAADSEIIGTWVGPDELSYEIDDMYIVNDRKYLPHPDVLSGSQFPRSLYDLDENSACYIASLNLKIDPQRFIKKNRDWLEACGFDCSKALAGLKKDREKKSAREKEDIER